MSSVPNRLQEGTNYTQAVPLINDNFDKVEVRALGATAVPIAIAADRNYFQGYLISVS